MKDIVEIKQIVKSFGGVNALDHLSLKIPSGVVTGLVGPNGSGKTTLVNILSGFLFPDSGRILFKEAEVTKILPWENNVYGLTRTFQQIRLFDQMNLLDNILVVLTERNPFLAIFEKHTMYHLKQAEDILKQVGLFEKRFHNAIDISYGQRKLLEIARVIAMDVDIILLDEPFAGLFPEIIKKVEEIIKDFRTKGKTVVLIEHNMAIIRSLCDNLVVMDAGRVLAEGKPDKVLSAKIVLEAYLGE